MAIRAHSIQGNVVSWAGHTTYIATSGTNHYWEAQAATLTVTGEAIDATETLSGDGAQVKLLEPGMRSWNVAADIITRLPQIGSGGQMSYGSGYDPHPQSWTLNLQWEVIDATSWTEADTGSRWRQFTPGIRSGTGTFTTFPDDGEAATLAATGDASSATFQIGTGNTIAVPIMVTGVSQTIDARGGSPLLTYSFEVGGTILVTSSGPGANFFPNSSEIPRDTPGSLVVTDGVNTYTGDAFWSAMSISCSPNDLVRMALTLQGTGDLAVTT